MFFFLFAFFFFFNDTATTEIYTLSLHDALPIYSGWRCRRPGWRRRCSAPSSDGPSCASRASTSRDRKSTRLNSSHEWISYAVFCLKKKTQADDHPSTAQQLETSRTIEPINTMNA